MESLGLEHVKACLPHMQPVMRAKVELQRYAGIQAGEVVQMRTADIDTTGLIWIYRPRQHKTKSAGKLWEVPIGPKVQAVLWPCLKPDLPADFVSPAEFGRQLRPFARQH